MHNEISKFNGSYQYEPRTYRYTIFGRTYTTTSYVPVVRENDGMNCDKTVMLPESMAGPGGKIINEQRSYYEPIWRCSDENAQYINGKQNFMGPNTYDCYYDYIYISYTVPVPQPHDGIVPVTSQQLDKSKGTNVIWANTSIKGVNHMEQRNHPNTKEEFTFAL